MPKSILELKDITCSLEKGSNIFSNVAFKINEGDVLVLQGRSGSGKSTLLKCIANLVAHSGDVNYRGSTPLQYGIPAYRTRIMYVPQRPSLLPGSPSDFLIAVKSLRAQQSLMRDKGKDTPEDVNKRAISIGKAWGIPSELWTRDWMKLSGGEGQRILIAAALAINTAEILLLDEPTSALDAETSLLVEEYILDRIHAANSTLKALIWITHSAEQSKRVGTRFIHLSAGGYFETEDYSPLPSAYPYTTTIAPRWAATR
ncbi:P-loop containing nucleoside triphosphate hydrolase protein [Pholiota conissans]|uniref:P-loop containing nucleoside triphosphate hydrolase protein n=1 Tax=Pholiota conissans TaxID=109636 RepID=A0A9P6CXB2_9AGAR|nr:P-loop containing nucleoside triphosphate hydrolase protein [Pholiota conissans]